jgi:prepilin-type N-terminal cleavage/methylation domain-containing protein
MIPLTFIPKILKIIKTLQSEYQVLSSSGELLLNHLNRSALVKVDKDIPLRKRYICRNKSGGFTLIELLTTIGILGLLVSLSLNSYSLYVASAGYGVAQLSLRQGITSMEASLSVPDKVYDSFNYSQAMQGALSDNDASQFLPEFQVPRLTKVSVMYDNGCNDASCTSQRMTVRHCRGVKYTFWSRFGDGTEALVEDLPGVGCP